jgi:exodeoxyribonuclease VII small subunit
METNLSYEAAYKELAQIAKEIESDNVSIDVLAQKVKRASELITYCQAKLKSTETEVNNIIGKMEQSSRN